MSRKTPNTHSSKKNELTSALGERLSNLESNEIKDLEEKIITYVADGVRGGWDISLTKVADETLLVKTLQFVEEPINSSSQIKDRR